MNLLQLIASSSFITLNKNLIKIFGLDGAAIVGMFASTHNFLELEAEKKGSVFDGWFYKTYEDIEEYLGLSKHIASNAIDKLIERDILIDKRHGIPCRRFFKFQEDKLFNSLSLKILTTRSEQDSPQVDDVLLPQASEKINDIYKNKNKNKSLSLLEEMQTFWKQLQTREKYNFEINLEKFHDWIVDEEDLKVSWKNALKSWAKKPQNQIKDITEDSREIKIIRQQIKRLFMSNQMEYNLIFAGCEIRNRAIFVKDKNALKYQPDFDKIGIKIELENK